MSVPNTNTFDLLTVINVIGLGTGDGLQECFDDSDDSEFDSSYNPNSDGTDNNLLNFRNYDSGSLNTLVVSTQNIGDFYYANIGNFSDGTQNVSYTWKYVQKISGTGNVTISYGGVARAEGYTTPTITGSINQIGGSDTAGRFFARNTFDISPDNSNWQAEFEFTLLVSAYDIVPTSPNNKTTFTAYIGEVPL
tara:strand:- start:234 stop:812 length:579 start_codon:yes stop_codon:yes gene_type:complete